MNAHTLIAIALAALLVFAGGAAALPGNAPEDPGTDAADDHAPDDPGADADDEANETSEASASEGPPTDLPEPVPDHVTTIHQLILDKLDGELGSTTLGEAISDVVGSDDAADEQAENGAEQAADASENADERAETAGASVAADLPQQAADHVAAIHDAISAFLHGDGDSPGDAVSSAAQG